MGFSNEIKTVLKLEGKDWEKALDSIKKAEKLYFEESKTNTQELIKAKENLSSSEKKRAKELLAINKEIARSESAKAEAIENGNKQTEKSLNKNLKLLKQQRTELIANSKVEVDTAKQSVSNLNSVIFAQERYSTILKKTKANYEEIRKAEATQKVATNETTASIDKKATATSNLANQTIRYLRWAGTIAGVVYAGKRAWDATLGQGIEVNKIIESNTYGIAALVSANTRMIDSLGNTLTPLQKFQMGQEHAKKAIEEIRKESVTTAATFPQLLEIFQQGIGKTLSLGSAFGETTSEIEKNTIKLSARMSNFANAIGMPMDRVREEMRSLVSANASTDSLISTIIFGSPTEANKAVKEASKKVNGLSELLDEKFKPFDILADTKTFEKSVLTVQDAWSRLVGDMVKESGMFKDITNLFYDTSASIINNTSDIVKTFDEMYGSLKKDIIPTIKDLATISIETGKVIIGVGKEIADVYDDIFKNSFSTNVRLMVADTTSAVKLIIDSVLYGATFAVNKIQNLFLQIRKAWPETLLAIQTSAASALPKGLSDILGYSEKDIIESQKAIATLRKQIADNEIEIAEKLVEVTSKADKNYENLIKTRKEALGTYTGEMVSTLGSFKTFEDKPVSEEIVKYKQLSELIANLAIDSETIAEQEKLIETSKSKIVEYEETRLKYQNALKENQEKLAQEKSREKADTIAIATLEGAIATNKKALSIVEANISEEKQKQNEKSLSASESLKKKAVELNREYADQQAILAEIAMYEAGQVDDERLKISLQQIKLDSLVVEYDNLTKIEDKQKVLRDIYKESLVLSKMATDEEAKQLAIQNAKIEKQNKLAVKALTGEFTRSVDAGTTLAGAEQSAALIRGKIVDLEATEAQMQKFDETVRNKLDKIKDDYFEKPFKIDIELDTSNLGDSLASYDKISKVIKTAGEEQKQWNDRVVQYEGIINSTSVNEEEKAQAKKEFNLEEQKHLSNQIIGYSNLAGAIAGLFDEGSKEAAAFQVAQTALALVEGTRAILTAGTGDPYTAIPRMIAMGAMVSSLLSNIGVAFGMNKTTTTSDAFSSMEANTGIGSVLGDAEAQSESITKSMSILEDFAQPQYQTLTSMNKYLASIANNIGGMTSLLIQSGGFAFGEGAYEYDTGYKNNLNINSGLMGALNPVTLVDKLWESIGLDFLSGIGSGIVNSVLGGIFGKTKVSQELTDSGLYFADAFLGGAIEALSGQAYQEIATTTTKKSWFSKSSSTVVNSYFEALDDETNRQFSLVLGNIYDTVLLSGDALDRSSSELANQLNNFVVSIGKISLKDKTGEEIQEELTAVFGKVADDLAKSTFPLLTPFQQVGEGLFETLTRVSVGMEEAEFYISRLGKSFNDLSYTSILNPQGDVGFEALLQSIIKTDEALYGLDNNLVNIIGNLNSTAEELYITYTALDSLRDRIKFLNQDINGLSNSMIYGAGSLDALQSGFESYFESFLSEEEQLSYQTIALQKELAKMNIAMPITKEAFKDMLNSFDLTTEAGQELYGRLISVSEAFAEVAERVEDSIQTIQDSLQAQIDEYDALVAEQQDAFIEILVGIADIGTAFKSTIVSISDTIDTLLGNKTGTDSQDAQIEAFWNKKAQIETLVAKGSNITSVESEQLKTLTSELGSLSTSLQSGYVDNTFITDNLVTSLSDLESRLDFTDQILQVNIVDGLGELLGLNAEQVKGLQESLADGKVTNTELDHISSYSVSQYQELLSINQNGIKVTDEQIKKLETLNEAQKTALLQANQDGVVTNTELSNIKSLTSQSYSEFLSINQNGIKVTDSQIQGLTALSEAQKSELIKANADGKITNTELTNLYSLTAVQKEGVLEFANNSNYFSTEATLSNLEKWSKLQLDAYQQSLTEETASLSKQSFAYGNYIGKQEQIDIAQTLGTSYESAKPLIQQLQGFSVSSNLQGDVNNLLGFNGSTGWTTYDANIASQISNLSPYLSKDILSAVEATKNAANYNAEQKRIAEAFAAARADFYSRLTLSQNNYSKEVAESSAARDLFNTTPISKNSSYYEIPENITTNTPFKKGGYSTYGGNTALNNTRYSNYLTEFRQAYSAYQTLKALEAEKAQKGYATGGYTGPGNKYDIAGIVHKNEYVIPSEDVNAIGGEVAIQRMLDREIASKAVNTQIANSYNISNDNNGIIKAINKLETTIIAGFNGTMKLINELVDHNDERREQGYLTKVTGSVTIAG